MEQDVTDQSHEDVALNYREVCQKVAEAEAEAGRPTGSVALVAVSKTHGAERIAALAELGHRLFGENRVQEAAEKFPRLKERFPGLTLHLIGPLQSNKVRDAVALFDVIETVDRAKLAAGLAEEMVRTGRRLPCYIQVNVGREPQKAGIDPDRAADFSAECRERWQLPVAGMMCIPPAADDPRSYFEMLAKIADGAGLTVRSMGMSGDFPSAIAAGATHVRVGTALFGRRPPVTLA